MAIKFILSVSNRLPFLPILSNPLFLIIIFNAIIAKFFLKKIFPGSSVVERSPVKRLAVGSNPTQGALFDFYYIYVIIILMIVL